MALTLAAIGAIGSGALGLGKLAFGAIQRSQARRDLERLNENKPYLGVPLAIRRRADEPVAEELMQAQADEARRRTGQGIGALGKAGTRGILGGLPSLLDAERQNERTRMSNYAQERTRALADLGRAEERVQDRQQRIWENQVAGARAEMGAGQQNIFGGFSDLGTAGITALGEMKIQKDANKIGNIKDVSMTGSGGARGMQSVAPTINPSLPNTMQSSSLSPIGGGYRGMQPISPFALPSLPPPVRTRF